MDFNAMGLVRFPLVNFFLFALLTQVASPSEVYAKPTRITKRNLSQFTLLSSADKFVCYKTRAGQYFLGTIDKRSLKTASSWSRADEETLTKRLGKLERLLQRLWPNTAPYTKARKDLKRTELLLAKAKLYTGRCAAQLPGPNPDDGPPPSNDPEFGGDVSSLAPFRNELTPAELTHLLDKVAFGGSDKLRALAQGQGLAALVKFLTQTPTSSAVHEDALFWARRQMPFDPIANRPLWFAFPLQLAAFYEAIFTENPFHTRMALLVWHSHFAVNLARANLQLEAPTDQGILDHWELLRSHALGNFSDLAKRMVLDSAMTSWLNNEDNQVGAPNQNFGREFLELFTLGPVDPITKVPNYDERSITAATGYFSGYYPNMSSGVRVILFDPARKDNTPYTVFPGQAQAEATYSFSSSAFVDHVLFNHPGSARYIAERLFAVLVTPDVPESVVNELANDLRSNGYNLAPVLAKILRSRAMFSPEARRACVASPVDRYVHLARKLFTTPFQKTDDKLKTGDRLLWIITGASRRAGQAVFQPPSVFAWEGACGMNRNGKHRYGEGFISEQSVLNRSVGGVEMLNVAIQEGYKFASLLPSLELTPEAVVDTLAWDLFGIIPTEEQRSKLVFFLTHGKNGTTTVEVPFDLADETYTQHKLPGLISLLFDMLEANSR